MSVNTLKYPEIRSNIVATHNILHIPQRSEQPRKYNKKASKQAIFGSITGLSLGSPNWARTSDIMINSHALSTVYIHIPVKAVAKQFIFLL